MWLRNALLTAMVISTLGVSNHDKVVLDYIEKDMVEYIKTLKHQAEENNILKQGNEDKKEIENTVELLKFNVDGLKLTEGISSETVFKVNKFLIEKGYTDTTESYYYDTKTKENIIKYQKENNLVADGIIGRNTYQKINEDIEMNKISIPDVNLSFEGEVPEGYWMMINKSNNTLYYLRGQEIINRYPIATGKDPRYTPEGKFTIVTKYKNPSWGGAGRYEPVRGGAPNNPLGKRWMGLSIKGGGTYGIHGNSNKGSIGRYASLGCVRMFNEDVENLYELIEIGTPVWVGSEIKLKEYGVSF